jgi:hypothetical protein
VGPFHVQFITLNISDNSYAELVTIRMSKYSVEVVSKDLNLSRVKPLEGRWKDAPGFVLLDTVVENLEKIQKMEIHSDDIWMICMPKTGSTFLQEMIWLLNNDLDFERAKRESIINRYVEFEYVNFSCFWDPQKPLI